MQESATSPAMMAGVVDHVWTIEELFDNVKQDRIAAERYEKLRRKLFGDA